MRLIRIDIEDSLYDDLEIIRNNFIETAEAFLPVAEVARILIENKLKENADDFSGD